MMEKNIKSNVTRQDVVNEAIEWIGTSYIHRQSRKLNGADCLGFVAGVYSAVHEVKNIELPQYSRDIGEVGEGSPMLVEFKKYLHEITEFSCGMPKSKDDYKKMLAVPGRVGCLAWKTGYPVKHCYITLGDGIAIQAINNRKISKFSLSSWYTEKTVALFELSGYDQ